LAKKRKVSAYNRHVGREMKAGKTMKQAAASWKRKGKPARKKTTKGGTKKMAKRASKLFRNVSGSQALEDLIVGYAGGKVIHESQGINTGQAVALTRIGQGLVGHVANRRGKGKLVPGVIDLIDNALIDKVPIPILDDILKKLNLMG